MVNQVAQFPKLKSHINSFPGLDHRHCGEGTEDGAHHRQAQGDRGAGQGEGGRALVESVKGRFPKCYNTVHHLFRTKRRTLYRFYFSVHASLSSALLRLHVHCKLRHFSKIDYLYHRRLLWIVCNAVITG